MKKNNILLYVAIIFLFSLLLPSVGRAEQNGLRYALDLELPTTPKSDGLDLENDYYPSRQDDDWHLWDPLPPLGEFPPLVPPLPPKEPPQNPPPPNNPPPKEPEKKGLQNPLKKPEEGKKGQGGEGKFKGSGIPIRMNGGDTGIPETNLNIPLTKRVAKEATDSYGEKRYPDDVPGHLGCASSACDILQRSGVDIPSFKSVAETKAWLDGQVKQGNMTLVGKDPLQSRPGDVVVDPLLPHMGVVGTDGKIYNNSSSEMEMRAQSPEAWNKYIATDPISGKLDPTLVYRFR